MLLSDNKKAEIGAKGEQFVADYLRRNGYIIIKRNWHDSRYGEIDIVAENRQCIAFVEVKTRQKNALVSGLDAVDLHKQQRIKNASQTFMRRLRTTLPPRIDVAEVTVISKKDGQYQFEINYIKNAF